MPRNDGTGPVGFGRRDGRGRKLSGRGQASGRGRGKKLVGKGKKTGGKKGSC